MLRSIFLTVTIVAGNAAIAENRIDTQLPNAPELAVYGSHTVGVRTLELTNPDQVDVLALNAMGEKPKTLPRYDRTLTVEIWYPAAQDATGDTAVQAFLRDGQTEVTLTGQAMRDAATSDEIFPLVVISHGWPGNRFLLSHLAENIASKGYVVASIDHLESTYRTFQVSDQYFASFGSTLVNRPQDQIFVIDAIEALAQDENSFLNGLVDASNSALVGYSMGGYGAIVNAGGSVTQTAVELPFGARHGALSVHQSDSADYISPPDPRVKTVVAIAPWGQTMGVWDSETLKGISIPTLFVAGSQDDVSGYENGVRKMWQNSVKSDRALLTYNHANHNAAAPIPAPSEALALDQENGSDISEHYMDAAWDTARMNNILQHFVTAWLGQELKQETDKAAYLDLIAESDAGVWSMDDDGKATAEHTHWKGFAKRWAKGLRFERLEAE